MEEIRKKKERMIKQYLVTKYLNRIPAIPIYEFTKGDREGIKSFINTINDYKESNSGMIVTSSSFGNYSRNRNKLHISSIGNVSDKFIIICYTNSASVAPLIGTSKNITIDELEEFLIHFRDDVK